MPNLHATITRRLKDGTEFFPDQRMTRQEALKSYTWNAAYAAKEETLKGSLGVGKLADITVLSKNIMTVPEAEIPATDEAHREPRHTLVGRAEVVHGHDAGVDELAGEARLIVVQRPVLTGRQGRKVHHGIGGL